MRIFLAATLLTLALSALPLGIAPTAEAAAPCVFSYYNEPGCIVPNPCDPRFCDPFVVYWLMDAIGPLLP